MQNTTESPRFQVGALPPPVPARLSPPNLISQAPMLPLVSASLPKPASSPSGNSSSNAFATSLNPSPPPRPPAQRSSPGGVRRFVSWIVLLALLGGVAYVAIAHGPELMDRATGERVDEPEAPLAFPSATIAPTPIRTATYAVERTNPLGITTTHTVTTDFETGLSQLTVDRGEAPDMEMMAVFDEAVVRRIDQPQWYRLARGDFPVDASAGRTRWVRTLDELLPPDLRSLATIDRATESVVANVPTRRLLLSIDPQALAAAIAPVAGVDGQTPPAVALPPGIALRGDADLTVPLQLELWIDDSGLVRKLVLPPELGGETVTVTSVSADPFQTTYPTPDQVQPLTADALLALGS